jgi:anti-anti-sigma factor
MEICLTQRALVPLIRVRGEVDRAHSDYLFHGLSTAFLLRPKGGVIVDLSEVTYIDSSGFSAFLRLLRNAGEQSWVAAVVPPGHIRRLIEMVGLHLKPNFRIFESEDAAFLAARRQVPPQASWRLGPH